MIRAGSDTEVLWNDARHLKPDPVYKRAVSGHFSILYYLIFTSALLLHDFFIAAGMGVHVFFLITVLDREFCAMVSFGDILGHCSQTGGSSLGRCCKL